MSFLLEDSLYLTALVRFQGVYTPKFHYLEKKALQ